MKHKTLLIGGILTVVGLLFLYLSWIGIYQNLALCYKVWTHQPLSFLEDERGCYLYGTVMAFVLIIVPSGLGGVLLFKGIRQVQQKKA